MRYFLFIIISLTSLQSSVCQTDSVQLLKWKDKIIKQDFKLYKTVAEIGQSTLTTLGSKINMDLVMANPGELWNRSCLRPSENNLPTKQLIWLASFDKYYILTLITGGYGWRVRCYLVDWENSGNCYKSIISSYYVENAEKMSFKDFVAGIESDKIPILNFDLIEQY